MKRRPPLLELMERQGRRPDLVGLCKNSEDCENLSKGNGRPLKGFLQKMARWIYAQIIFLDCGEQSIGEEERK
jgi:hypothetical protein